MLAATENEAAITLPEELVLKAGEELELILE
jgi:hypothetical protein